MTGVRSRGGGPATMTLVDRALHRRDAEAMDTSAPHKKGQTMKPLHAATEAILKFFTYEHLPEHLQAVSQPFHDLAWDMACRFEGPELTTGLRKLLEAKDCMVRAAL